jgi:predicted small lipoprotein YifL
MKGYFALFLCFLLLAACGRKGTLVPPEGLVPAQVGSLQVMQRGETMQLAWPLTKKMESGGKLADLAGFRVMRHEVMSKGEECTECPDAWKLLWRVDLDYLQGVMRLGDRIYLCDFKIIPGKSYIYRVSAFNRDGSEGKPSVAVRRKTAPPLPAPALKAVSSQSAVLLELSYSKLPAGTTAKGFSIYRAGKGESLPIDPLHIEPLKSSPDTASTYSDDRLEPGVTYKYTAGLIADVDGESVESLLSPPVTAALAEPD